MELEVRIMVNLWGGREYEPLTGGTTQADLVGAAQTVFLDQGDYYIGMYALKYSSSCTFVACTHTYMHM